MSNPGGVNLNISPYYDDYDENKKFARILYRPGRAVQARELTQGQSIQQKQIERFANFFFKSGSIVQGCEQSIDLNMEYVKVDDNFPAVVTNGVNPAAIDVNNFLDKEIFGGVTGVKALVNLVTTTDGDDPKTFFINYLTSGAVRIKLNSPPTTLVVGQSVDFKDNLGTTQISGTVLNYDVDPNLDNTYYVWVDDLTDDFNQIPTSGNVTITQGTNIYYYVPTSPEDYREDSKFQNGEQIFTDDYNGRYYSVALNSNATQYVVDQGLATEKTYTKGSKATISEGVMYLADHFVLHSTQTIILDKYTNIPSYKVGLVPTKSFVDSAEDTSLVDNAQGTSNFQAPGADRLKIDTVLTKIAYNSASSETEFVSMIEIENGVVKKRREIELESKIEEAIAKRTSDESGDYTLSDPKITIREHLNTGTNNGRFSAGEGGDPNLLLLEIDPFTAYVSGYRNEIISRANVNLTKGLDSQEVEQVNTQINLGSFVPTKEFIGFWDIENSDEIDLYDTAQTVITSRSFDGNAYSPTGTKIGTARIKSVEYVSGRHGDPAAVFNAYIYNVVMNVGKTFQEVRSIYQNNPTIADCVADIVLDASGNATLREQAYDRLLFNLPYGSIKTLRDINGNLENGFRFRTEFSAQLTSGNGTVSSLTTNETFVGTGPLTGLQKNQNYAVIPQTTEIASVAADNVDCTQTSTTVTKVGSTFTTTFTVGEYVSIDSVIYRIVEITDNENLELDAAFTSATASYDVFKAFPAGVPIPMDINDRIMDVLTPSAINIDVKEPSVNLNVNFVATMDRANAREIKKSIVRDVEVYINPNSHPNGNAGPYSLGHSDIFAIKGIYQAGDFTTVPTTADTNVTLLYTLDNGQRDNTYENGKITPNVGIVPTGNLLIVFDHFNHDTTQGIGYLSVDSYPVDDAAGNTGTTISTTDIPTYVSPRDGSSYNLRNTLDFRPIKSNSTTSTVTAGSFIVGNFYEILTTGTTDFTAVGAADSNPGTLFVATDTGSNSGTATEFISNATESNTYVVPGGGSGLHIPVPNSDFQADLQYYKGRKAKLYMNYKGELGVVDGSPGYPNPALPPSVPDTIDLAELSIPAYPSLPKNVTITPIKNRRFTMKDIGKLQERVNNIEYYTALNLLEKESRDKIIVDSDGVERFKNGILADAFTGHSIADVSSPDYRAAIDRAGKYATTYFDNGNQISLDYNDQTSTGVYETDDNKLILNYNEVTFSDQPYASSSISLALPGLVQFIGDMKVVPATDNWLETTRNPNVDLVSDLTGESDNWKTLTDAWNTEVDPLTRHWVGKPNKASVLSTESEDYSISRLTTTNTGKQQIESSDIDLSSSLLNSAVDRVADISVSHTMRSRDFVFECTGLKNNTIMYAFFDGVNVTASCKQIVLKNGISISELNEEFDNDGTLTANPSKWEDFSAEPFESFVVRGGKIYGVFTVPANSFNVGFREFKLTDSPTNDNSAATTVAKYSIGSTGLAITKGQSSINTRPFSVAVDEANYVQSISRVSTSSTNYTTTNYIRREPLSQGFYIDESTYPRGVFLTSIDLFFNDKPSDSKFGVTLEIREMQNGFPTRKIIGNESVHLDNSEIITTNSLTTPTTFTFGSPIYLLPGTEYCFSIKPDGNRSQFKVWSAEYGQLDITDTTVQTTIDPQPAAGLLFTESSDFGWSIRQNQSLKYKMRIAEFSTTTSGIANFNNKEISSAVDYSRITTNIENLNISDTNIEYSINLYDVNDEQSGYLSIKNLERLELPREYQVKTGATSSLNVRATLTTSNKYISPYIDLERVHVIPENLQVNNLTQTETSGTVEAVIGTNTVTGTNTLFSTEVKAGQYIKIGNELRRVSSVTDNLGLTTINPFAEDHPAGSSLYTKVEEAPSSPYSSDSRYISRRVALNDGFEASDINVYVDVNRPAATDIKVYYKILNENDSDSFDDKFYREMTLEGTPAITQDTKSYTEEKYVIPVSELTGGVQILYGTVTTNGTDATVTGVGTRFTEELRIGDTVALGPNRVTGVVANVVNNTEITLEEELFTDVTAGNFAIGQTYEITSTGSTDFTLIGAANSTPGTVFTATGAGTGTGTARPVLSDVEIFEVLNNVVGYTTPDGRSYSGFKYYSIKVVFLSASPGYAPRIKNLRAIALA